METNMPGQIVTPSNNGNNHLSIYVPCHFDFSQVEYVAPFLCQYPRSKLFIYKWNGLYDKIKEHYLSEEYQKYELEVFDFTLQAIINCITKERPETRVVFLLTASMGYAFGVYQKILFTKIKVFS